MPIYIYRCEKCVCCFERLAFFLEKDDYNCGEHFPDRVFLNE
jgi:predicted nucleic acid-binding Zn ribbon protein